MQSILKIILLAFVGVIGVCSVAFAAGAISSSEEEGVVAIGLTTNADSRFQAGKDAMEQCKQAGGTDCKLATHFKNTCAAIVVGEEANGRAIGAFATDNDEAEAVKAAIASCEADGGKCAEHSSGCDGDLFVVQEEFSDLTLPQICTQLCADFDEQETQIGELTLALDSKLDCSDFDVRRFVDSLDKDFYDPSHTRAHHSNNATDFEWIVLSGDNHAVQCMLEYHNADANYHCEHNIPVLSDAVVRGYIDVVKTLIAAGAELNSVSSGWGDRPYWIRQLNMIKTKLLHYCVRQVDAATRTRNANV